MESTQGLLKFDNSEIDRQFKAFAYKYTVCTLVFDKLLLLTSPTCDHILKHKVPLKLKYIPLIK